MLSARLKSSFAVIGSMSTLAIAAWFFDWRALLSSAARMPASSLLQSALLCGATSVVLAFRWAMIVAPAGATFRVSEMLVALQAAVFNLITPAAIGGDIYRVTRASGQRLRRFGFVLVERLFGIWAQASIYVAALLLAPWPVSPVLSRAGWIFAAVAAGGAVAILAAPSLKLARSSLRIGRHVADLAAALTSHPTGRRALLAVLSLSGVLCWIAACWSLADGGGMRLTLAQVAMITIVTEFARLLPVAVQGIGVREAVFAWLSHLLGASAEEGFVVCALVYAVNALVIGGVGCAAALAPSRLKSGAEALAREG